MFNFNAATNEYRTIIKETDPNKIEANSAACFNLTYESVNYGHVVYIEAVENIGGVTYVYYSESYRNIGEANAGIIIKKPLTGFLQSWECFKGYVKIR